MASREGLDILFADSASTDPAKAKKKFMTHFRGPLEPCLQHYFLSEIIYRVAHGLHFVQVKRVLHHY
jgi:hypothetical protein